MHSHSNRLTLSLFPPPSPSPLPVRPWLRYLVDGRTLEAMDILESVRTGHYYKRLVEIEMTGHEDEAAWGVGGYPGNVNYNAPHRVCTVYFYPANDVLMRLPLQLAYTDAHHAK